ncbi:hypothetical protein [Burkholderia ubonensis]|uniref:hypothetical protein n=1 Tax=Burkholderia ubonensis TaxID=101571 RepID=UPI0009B3BFA5|nr:hypothetical protein [Burkholderia ubonensis]
MKDVKPLKCGIYLARCKESTLLRASLNGHSAAWPEASVRVARGVAHFTKDGVEVWSCNASYAALHFNITKI